MNPGRIFKFLRIDTLYVLNNTDEKEHPSPFYLLYIFTDFIFYPDAGSFLTI